MQVVEHLLILVAACLGNLVTYKIVDLILNYRNLRYKQLSYARKCYVVKNLTKSFYLFFFGVLFTPVLWRYLRYNQFSDWEFTAYGCLYTSTDLMGLLVVPNLPLTTKIHHLVVTLLGFATIFLVDFNQFGLSHAFIPLTYLSVVPYLVNTLLAFRFIAFPQLNRFLARISLIVYCLSILANIGFQHYYVFWLLPYHWVNFVYLFGVYYLGILRDDLKLLGYLYHKSLPSSTDDTESLDPRSDGSDQAMTKALLQPLPCEVSFQSSSDQED